MRSLSQYYANPLMKRGVTFVATACISVAAYAQNTIENVSGFTQGGREIVKIDLTEPLEAVPPGFVVQNPPRIALDFQNVESKLSKNTLNFGTGNLKSAQVVQSGSRSRVVINLKESANYRAALNGKSLLVTLDPVSAISSTIEAPRTFAENRNTRTMALRNIDFRRGADNSGRVVVDLPNNQVGVDIKPQGKNLVVDLLKSSLPPGLNKRFDVMDFGTPVQKITATQSGDKVRLVIATHGEWEHSAYQSDNQLVVELHPMRQDPDKLTQGSGYRGEKLSLNFQNVEIRYLLQAIAEFTNFNIVTSDTVTGNLTLRLKDVPWDQALDIVLQSKNLGMRKTGNVIRVAPKDEMEANEKRELEAKAAVSGLEPLRTQSFRLNYAKAETIADGLIGESKGGSSSSAKNTRMLSDRGSVIYETRTNQLFVTDVPSVLQQVEAMIAKLDIPVQQVMIEARMVEATDSWGRSLGVRLGVVGSPSNPTARGNNLKFGSANTDLYSLPASSVSSIGDYNPAAVALSIFTAGANRYLNLEISAIEADGKGKVISSPRIVTSNQTKATITQGVQLPYTTESSSGGSTVEFQDAVLSLEVTPQITPEGSVLMTVKITNDEVGQPTTAGYAINKKTVDTEVLVENGGTVLIGGIYTFNDSSDTGKVPLLGDIPVIGNLFKSRSRSTVKREMLVFLTPRIVSERAIIR